MRDGFGRGVIAVWLLCLVLPLAFLACSDETQAPAAPTASSSSPVASPSPSAPSEHETSSDAAAESAVRDAFEQYRRALIERDGDRAAELVSRSTLDLYEDMTDLALTATRSELMARRTIDRLNALFLRQLLTPRELQTMSGADVISFAVEEGLINDSSVVKLEPTRVNVLGPTAALDIQINEKPAPFSMTFRNEDGEWKIDLTELLDLSELAFRDQMNKSGLGEEEYLFLLVESISKKRATSDLWRPPA